MKIKIEGLDGVKRVIDERVYHKAARQAIYEAARNFKKEIVKDVREIYNIKAKTLKSKMAERFEKIGSMYVWEMEVKGRPLSLMHFGARQNKKGVSIKIRKDHGRKTIAGAFIPHTKDGMITMKQVFKRKGKSRLPIKALKTISVPQMFREEMIKNKLKSANRIYQKRFWRNVSFYASK